jgi:hypothetical protein
MSRQLCSRTSTIDMNQIGVLVVAVCSIRLDNYSLMRLDSRFLDTLL